VGRNRACRVGDSYKKDGWTLDTTRLVHSTPPKKPRQTPRNSHPITSILRTTPPPPPHVATAPPPFPSSALTGSPPRLSPRHATPHRRCHLPSFVSGLVLRAFFFIIVGAPAPGPSEASSPLPLAEEPGVSLTELENRYSYSVPVGAAAAAPASVVLRTRQGTTGRARGLTAAASLCFQLLVAAAAFPLLFLKSPSSLLRPFPPPPFFLRSPAPRSAFLLASPRLPPFPTLSLLFIPLPIRSAGARQEGNPPGRPFRSRAPPAASFPAGVRVAACMQGLVWLGFSCHLNAREVLARLSLLACALRLLAS
jgi:hypothetical protein